MILSINQPAYLPWLGYFDRIAKSDLHVVLDHVQFEKNSFTNRNKIRTKNGWTWLTVPVKTKGRFNQLPICDVEIDNTQAWARKHRDSIWQAYKKAPYFDAHWAWFEHAYAQPWERLASALEWFNGYLLEAFCVSTPVVYSSTLQSHGHKDELVLNICRELGATTYLSGPLGRDYLSVDAFRVEGIELAFHDFEHPEYRQVHGSWIPFMSSIDLLFNEGAAGAERVLYGKRE